MKKYEILEKINKLIEEYIQLDFEDKKFIPGKTRIQFGGPVYDSKEIISSLNSLLSGWFTTGSLTKRFEREFAKCMGVEECTTVNSGSSALLLAWNALKSESIENPIKSGDEIITGGVTHTATANSIILNNLKPVLVDVEIPTYNIDVSKIEEAITENTKGILPMHFMGNPCEMDKILSIAKKYGLHIVEDACDAFGSEYKEKKIGSFGDFGTASFYTAHGITLGEGGAIFSNNRQYM
jgi:CDP-6-deoxy-D-xylo-4-hexulose-3-dehydrase